MKDEIAKLCQELQIDCKIIFTIGCDGWSYHFYDHFTDKHLGRTIGGEAEEWQALCWLEGHQSAQERLGAVCFPVPEDKGDE